MDEAEKKYLSQLEDLTLPEGDFISSIEMLEVLLVIEALPKLMEIVRDVSHTMDVRESAAHAVFTLSSPNSHEDMTRLSESVDPDLCKLGDIGLTGGHFEKPGGAWYRDD